MSHHSSFHMSALVREKVGFEEVEGEMKFSATVSQFG